MTLAGENGAANDQGGRRTQPLADDNRPLSHKGFSEDCRRSLLPSGGFLTSLLPAHYAPRHPSRLSRYDSHSRRRARLLL